jgi:signal transduction histidine kinase
VELDRYLFSVKDNGIGIDKKYNSKLFKIFSRINPSEEFEGTGAGLAISKKIVEHLGGKIWIESEPGVGSTFYFNLPRKNDPPGVE